MISVTDAQRSPLADRTPFPDDLDQRLREQITFLVEIYAGDTPLYDRAAGRDQRQRELAAADEICRLLPEDQGLCLRAWWDEFEERRTPEARFAKAMDRLQPLLNWMARGGTWKTPVSRPMKCGHREGTPAAERTAAGVPSRRIAEHGSSGLRSARGSSTSAGHPGPRAPSRYAPRRPPRPVRPGTAQPAAAACREKLCPDPRGSQDRTGHGSREG